MFAEFEKLIHATAESGEPLTVDRFQEIYRELAGALFRARFRARRRSWTWNACGFRTSIGRSTSTSTPPACRPPSPWPSGCCGGGRGAGRLSAASCSGGCSKDPLDLLRGAGVDMEQPAAVDAALGLFGRLVDQNWMD